MAKIFGIGETIYNITMRGGCPVSGAPGGDFFNSMIDLGRKGLDVSYISEVGSDHVGQQILAFMQENGVHTESMYQFYDGRTPLTLAHLNDDGSAEYDYYAQYPTNNRLDVVWPRIDDVDYVLYGSDYLLGKDLHGVAMDLLEYADTRRALLVYCPDLQTMESGRAVWLMPMIIDFLEKSNLVIMTDGDMSQLYRSLDVDAVYHDNIMFYCKQFMVLHADGVVDLRTPTVKKQYAHLALPAGGNMIGMDDAFRAGIVFGLQKHGQTRDTLGELSEAAWDDIVAEAQRWAIEVAASEFHFVEIPK